jgi:type I restriction enzyme, S subunit
VTSRFVPLHELFDVGSSKRVLKSQWKSEGVPFYRGREVTRLATNVPVNNELFISESDYAEYSEKSGVPSAGDIVVTAIGTIGNSYVVREGDRFYFKDASVLWLKKATEVCSDYINLWLKSPQFFGQLDKGNGATVDTLTIRKLRGVLVVLPPLPEQQRIVAILDEAFAAIDTAIANTEKNRTNARELFDTLLDTAIQGNLVPQKSDEGSATDLINRIVKTRNDAIRLGKAKSEKTEPIEAKEDQVQLPETWKWSHLESLTLGISDGVHKKPKYVSDGIPFVTVKNLTAGKGISFDDLNYITPEDHEEFTKRTHPEKGDILISKDGTIGVVRLIETDVTFSIFVSVALIKPVLQEVGPYLAYALRAPCVQTQIVPKGAALKHLYLVDLRRLSIPFPPLDEQKRIVVALEGLNAETQRLSDLYERKLTALEELKGSLLHQAFSGALSPENATI